MPMKLNIIVFDDFFSHCLKKEHILTGLRDSCGYVHCNVIRTSLKGYGSVRDN